MRYLLLLTLSIVPFLGYSQKSIDSETGTWLMYFGNHKISEKWSIHTEYQFRRVDFVNNWQQSLARIGVDYHLNKQNAITAGYGWIISFPYGEQPISVNTTEHRIWQQFVTKADYSRFYFNHRYRLEQRFIENASLIGGEKSVDGFKFRQRARYRLLLTIPITKRRMEDNTLFFSTYAEVFLGFGKGIGPNVLDQNRIYGALGWKLNKQSNVQLGYLNQFIFKANGIQAERNHLLQLSFTYNLDFSKT